MSMGIVRLNFELDRNLYELRQEGAGWSSFERIPLDLLFLLVERRNYLVSREEIIEHIWSKKGFLRYRYPTHSGSMTSRTRVKLMRGELHCTGRV